MARRQGSCSAAPCPPSHAEPGIQHRRIHLVHHGRSCLPRHPGRHPRPGQPDFERRYWTLRRMNAQFRVLGHSWWREEMPSEAEYAEAEANLDRAGWCVDCILTHCAPTSIAQRLGQHYQPDELTDFLETIKERCQFSKWFCGHYHVNQVIDERFVIQWEQISWVE